MSFYGYIGCVLGRCESMDTLVSCANVVWSIHLALGLQAGLYDGGLVLEITRLEFIRVPALCTLILVC